MVAGAACRTEGSGEAAESRVDMGLAARDVGAEEIAEWEGRESKSRTDELMDDADSNEPRASRWGYILNESEGAAGGVGLASPKAKPPGNTVVHGAPCSSITVSAPSLLPFMPSELCSASGRSVDCWRSRLKNSRHSSEGRLEISKEASVGTCISKGRAGKDAEGIGESRGRQGREVSTAGEGAWWGRRVDLVMRKVTCSKLASPFAKDLRKPVRQAHLLLAAEEEGRVAAVSS